MPLSQCFATFHPRRKP